MAEALVSLGEGGVHVEAAVVFLLLDVDLCHVEVDGVFELVGAGGGVGVSDLAGVHGNGGVLADDAGEVEEGFVVGAEGLFEVLHLVEFVALLLEGEGLLQVL
jgi:hypothetical protein